MPSSTRARSPQNTLRVVALALILACGLGWLLVVGPIGTDPMIEESAQEPVDEFADGVGVVERGSSGMALAQEESSRAPQPADEAGRTELPPQAYLLVRATWKKFSAEGRRVVLGRVGAENGVLPAIPEAVTDRGGKARFSLTPNTRFTVEVERQDGASSVTRSVQLGDAGSETRVRMELFTDVPTARIVVVARSIPDGAPIVGAKVSALRGDIRDQRLVGTSATTDFEGKASLPWARGYRYEVTARGHSPWVVESPAAVSEPLEIGLVRHARIYGRLAHLVLPDPGSARPPRIIIFQGGGPSAGTSSEYLEEIGDDDGHPFNLFDDRNVLIRPQARLDHSGRWDVRCVPFTRERMVLEGVIVRCALGTHTRTIAKGLVLRPGDNVLVHDQALGAPGLNMQFVGTGGRDLDLAGEIYLLRLDGPDNDAVDLDYSGEDAVIAKGGRLHLPQLPTGKWCVMDPYGDLKVRELAVFEHRSAAQVKILIAEESIPDRLRVHLMDSLLPGKGE